jgi:hypothetical protein
MASIPVSSDLFLLRGTKSIITGVWWEKLYFLFFFGVNDDVMVIMDGKMVGIFLCYSK